MKSNAYNNGVMAEIIIIIYNGSINNGCGNNDNVINGEIIIIM